VSRVVVTGVSGFVGKALAGALLREGHSVVGLSRRPIADRSSSQFSSLAVDLADEAIGLETFLEGADAVFHVAAKVGMWGSAQEFHRGNVQATERVVGACKRAGVKRLIFTSSPSVVASGKDLINADESTPYPDRFLAEYPRTKAEAERLVLAAHSDQLSTVALRPHLIFGPGEKNLIPTILRRAKAGRLVGVGRGDNVSDFTYVEDCVAAHLCAERALAADPAVGGRPYFVSQGQPYPLWGFIDRVLELNGLSKVRRYVPTWVADAVAASCEFVARLGPSSGEPLLTRFMVEELSRSHYFDISAAKTRLGFRPTYSVEDALTKTFARPMITIS
jgi:nucleoside-diphosphate-sugar epimerase